MQIPLFHHITNLLLCMLPNRCPSLHPSLFLCAFLFLHSPLLTSTTSVKCFVFQTDHFRKVKNCSKNEIMYSSFAPHDCKSAFGFSWELDLTVSKMEYICQEWQPAKIAIFHIIPLFVSCSKGSIREKECENSM